MRQLEEEIFVFDSLYHTVSSCMKRQIAALLETKHNVITLKHMLFAIAFATARVHGEHIQRRGEVAKHFKEEEALRSRQRHEKMARKKCRDALI